MSEIFYVTINMDIGNENKFKDMYVTICNNSSNVDHSEIKHEILRRLRYDGYDININQFRIVYLSKNEF